jgi:dihydroorotate dehydrogenase (fumarate)
MIDSIQSLRRRFKDSAVRPKGRIAIELNTSCPNIIGKAPPAYDIDTVLPLLMILADAHKKDKSLTIGLKLAPYIYQHQFTAVLDAVRKFSYCVEDEDENEQWFNPFAFFTCTNTLGNSLLFPTQTLNGSSNTNFALPNLSGLGGLAGEHLHPLALGNVLTISTLIKESPEDHGLKGIKIIGVGGVTDYGGVKRMRDAGASIVGAATVWGREGLGAFEKLAGQGSVL